MKAFNNKYLKVNPHTKGIKFYFPDERRIDVEDVPEGFYRYQIRHKDTSAFVKATLEKRVVVNHYHDVLATAPIPYLDEDRNFIGLRKDCLEEGVDNGL